MGGVLCGATVSVCACPLPGDARVQPEDPEHAGGARLAHDRQAVSLRQSGESVPLTVRASSELSSFTLPFPLTRVPEPDQYKA